MKPPENTGSDGLDSAHKIILRWDSTASKEAHDKMIFEGNRQEIDEYLYAVDEIQRSLKSCNNTIHIAMSRLEDEFRNLLITQTSPLPDADLLVNLSTSSAGGSSRPGAGSDINSNLAECDGVLAPGSVGSETPARKDFDHQESGSSSNYSETDSIWQIVLLSSDAVYNLRSIAERMIAAGWTRECIQVYEEARKAEIDANLRKLGIEKLSIEDVQKLEWEILDKKIKIWIMAAKVAIRILFASEKKLCEKIFKGLGTDTDDSCFTETIKEPAFQLFNFAEAVSIIWRSPEKLFKILDIYDALSELLSDMEVVFASDSLELIRVKAVEILSRLAEAARGILSEFEIAVLREPSIAHVAGGTIHPLTRYVMNYISLVSDYKSTLSDLIVSRPSTDLGDDPDSNPDFVLTESEEEKIPLALHLIWIVVILHFNLDYKSKHYRDAALSHLFMMNNVYYIVQKSKGSPELMEMIGDDYLKKLSGKIKEAAIEYQRAAWFRVLHCLREEGIYVSDWSSQPSKTVLCDRFLSFNASLEEVHKTQATWLVPDVDLRNELRLLISERLILAYRTFLGRFRSYIEGKKHLEKCIKYEVEDVENMVSDLFEGPVPVSQHRRRKILLKWRDE